MRYNVLHVKSVVYEAAIASENALCSCYLDSRFTTLLRNLEKCGEIKTVNHSRGIVLIFPIRP